MSYVVLARKWRPMTFSDLVGQDHVAATLGNAIKTGRIAHAFLFTGVRGVGKTTSARILAKALNCLTSDGPSAQPCLECAACKEITEGHDVDVQEIDGASYNGVDEVRRLQESLPYRPSRDRFKIVIVDEVHMLSTNAWNAFLKTLEEPPPHVKFIFATTEVHKVPVTILSRVQRFDFKLIPTRAIMKRLSFVLEHEKIASEEAALAIIAREAAGSMRDAMSLLDQVIAWSDQNLTEADVTNVLGVASRKVLYDLTAAMIAGDTAKPLKIVDDLATQGFDISHVTRDLLSVLRDVVVTKSSDAASELVDLPEEERESVARLAQHSLDDLIRLHQGFSQSFDDVVRSGQPRAALEMLLVRLARRPPLIPIDDLVERLMRLEKRLQSSARGGSGGSSAGGSSPIGTRGTQAGRQSPGARTAPPVPDTQQQPGTTLERPSLHGTKPRARGTHASPPPADEPAARQPVPPTASAEPVHRQETVAHSADASAGPRAAEAEAASNPSPLAEAVHSAPATPKTPPAGRTAAALVPAPHTAAAAPASAPASSRVVAEPSQRKVDESPPSVRTATDHASSPADDENDPTLRSWRRLLDALRATEPKLAAFLEHAQALEVGATRISIRYEKASVVEVALQDPTTITTLLDHAETLWGQRPQLSAEPAAARLNGETVFSVDKQRRDEQHQAEIDAAKNHHMVQEAIRVLGARVKNIELPKS